MVESKIKMTFTQVVYYKSNPHVWCKNVAEKLTYTQVFTILIISFILMQVSIWCKNVAEKLTYTQVFTILIISFILMQVSIFFNKIETGIL